MAHSLERRTLKFELTAQLKRIPLRFWAVLGTILAAVSLIIGFNGRPLSFFSVPMHNFEENISGMELLQNHWRYLPGSWRVHEGLHIGAIPFKIVDQDGTGGQANRPLNLYGAHLETTGDFKLKAQLANISDGTAIGLYGEVPIVYDEFRYERNSLLLSFTGSQLHVEAWQSGSQTPTIDTNFPLPEGDENRRLEITRSSGSIILEVDDSHVGTVQAGDVFNSGKVWFGASADKKAWTLTSLKAEQVGTAKLKLVDALDIKAPTLTSDGLQQLASLRRPDLKIGAAMALAPLVSDAEYREIALGGNFGIMTLENVAKAQFIHPTPGNFAFQETDAMVSLAKRHNMQVHGHALVFGEAMPKWLQDLPTSTLSERERVIEKMNQHIKTIVGRYAGKIVSWDVVNEPLADYDEFEQGQLLRDHVFNRALPEDYIVEAFNTAHEADPRAQLYINEFGLEADDDRWEAFLPFIKRLLAKGAPIDGVGFQAHVYESGDETDLNTLKQHMKELAKLGLKARISENDVYKHSGQATQYAVNLQACLESPNCTSYTTWGISDRYNMFKDGDSLEFGEDFLWDANMKPTTAVEQMRQVLRK